VAPRGTPQWVRNVRVSGGGRLVHGRKVEEFSAAEVPLEERSQRRGAATNRAGPSGLPHRRPARPSDSLGWLWRRRHEGAVFVTGVWAPFERQPAWVFTFPNNTNDAIFHLVGAAFFGAVALIQISRDRPASRD